MYHMAAKKILYVDNNPEDLSAIGGMLRRGGYDVFQVEDGDAAFDAIRDGAFDLVLLDIMLNGLTGWDIFTKVRKTHPHQKIAFVTVLEVSPKRKRELQKIGIGEYFTKPVEEKDFLSRIERLLNSSEKA